MLADSIETVGNKDLVELECIHTDSTAVAWANYSMDSIASAVDNRDLVAFAIDSTD